MELYKGDEMRNTLRTIAKFNKDIHWAEALA